MLLQVEQLLQSRAPEIAFRPDLASPTSLTPQTSPPLPPTTPKRAGASSGSKKKSTSSSKSRGRKSSVARSQSQTTEHDASSAEMNIKTEAKEADNCASNSDVTEHDAAEVTDAKRRRTTLSSVGSEANGVTSPVVGGVAAEDSVFSSSVKFPFTFTSPVDVNSLNAIMRSMAGARTSASLLPTSSPFLTSSLPVQGPSRPAFGAPLSVLTNLEPSHEPRLRAPHVAPQFSPPARHRSPDTRLNLLGVPPLPGHPFTPSRPEFEAAKSSNAPVLSPQSAIGELCRVRYTAVFLFQCC